MMLNCKPWRESKVSSLFYCPVFQNSNPLLELRAKSPKTFHGIWPLDRDSKPDIPNTKQYKIVQTTSTLSAVSLRSAHCQHSNLAVTNNSTSTDPHYTGSWSSGHLKSTADANKFCGILSYNILHTCYAETWTSPTTWYPKYSRLVPPSI
jgi:hypothetical protein